MIWFDGKMNGKTVEVALVFLIVVLEGCGNFVGQKLKENVEFFSQDNAGGILRRTLKINDSTFYISNIYAPNNGKDRKSFCNAINDTLFKYTDDSDKNYSLILIALLKKT